MVQWIWERGMPLERAKVEFLGTYMFPPKLADVTVFPATNTNVFQMHSDIDMRTLPQQKMNDKTFIFTDEE